MSGNRIIIYILILLCLVSMTISVSAQEPFNVNCIRQFENNWHRPVYDVAIEGNYAYLAFDEEGVRIVDISQPDEYLDIAHLELNQITAVAIAGQYLYLGEHNDSLYIIDVSNKANPEIAVSMPMAGSKSAIRIFGDRAFVCTSQGLRVLDISNPLEPVELWFYGGSYVHDVVIRDTIAYLACGNYNLRVFDITNISSPIQIGSYGPTYDSGIWDIDLHGNYGVIAAGDHGFEIIDLTTLQIVSRIDSLYYALWVKVKDNYAYLAYGYPECPLAIIDLSSPTMPQVTSIYYPPEDIATFDISGDDVFIADYRHGLRRVDISDPANPIESSHYNKYGFDTEVTIRGNIAFVKSEFKLTAIDLQDPAQPQELGHFETNWEFNDYAFDGDIVYILGAEPSKFYSVDFSDPSRPVLLQQIDPQGYHLYYNVEIYQNYAYLLTWDQLQILDITDPANMSVVANITIESISTVFRFFDHYAIIQNQQNSLVLMDFSDPLQPVAVSSYPVHRYCYDLEIIGGLLYVGAYDHLMIFDISNLSNWQLLSDINAQGEEVSLINKFDIIGNKLYLTVRYSGLFVYDISDPSDLAQIGYYSCPGYSYDVAAMGDVAVVCDYLNLGIYDCSQAQGTTDGYISGLPTQLALYPNYPNPFNSSTVIRFEIAAAGNVAVEIIDLLGRKVAAIADESFQPGLHSIRWDGSDMNGQVVSSGQYFVKVRSGSISRSTPVTLLK